MNRKEKFSRSKGSFPATAPGGSCRVIIGGSGGQGVVTVGKLLACAAMKEGCEVACYPVYGAEMRGGYAFASLVFSRRQVFSPIISRAEAGIFLSPFSFSYLRSMVVREGIVLVNSDLVAERDSAGAKVFSVPCASLAREAGDERAANMVAAGFLARLMENLSGRLDPFPAFPALKEAVPQVFPGRKNLWALNRRALSLGHARGAGDRNSRDGVK